MDLFNLALQGKYNQMYEYYLVGSVLDPYKEGFLEILRGLCDTPEIKPTEFSETDNGASVSLRARHSEEQGLPPYCHLRYIGQTDFKMDRDRKTMVRNFMDCLASPHLNDYLHTIGFNEVAKIPIKCYLFHKGRLKILVSKFYASQGPELQPIAQSSLVEISCIVSSVGQESMIADELKRFADMLKPYVRMDKIHQIMEDLSV